MEKPYNPFDFSGKVTLVAGAATGMGLATANALDLSPEDRGRLVAFPNDA